MIIRLPEIKECTSHSTVICVRGDKYEISYGHGNDCGQHNVVAEVYFKRFDVYLIGGAAFKAALAESKDQYQTAWLFLRGSITLEQLEDLFTKVSNQEYQRGRQNKIAEIKECLGL